jgi:hypothetical protein
MLNSGNNDQEQNWQLLIPGVKRAQSDSPVTVTLGCPRVKRAQSDWRATVILGCPRWGFERGWFSQKSRIFTVNFKDIFKDFSV